MMVIIIKDNLKKESFMILEVFNLNMAESIKWNLMGKCWELEIYRVRKNNVKYFGELENS
jgi:hypothetical protein